MRFSSSWSSSSWRSGAIRLHRGFALLEQLEFPVQLRILDLLAVFIQALQPLLDHHQVAEDQLGLDVFQIPQRIDTAFLVRNGIVLKQPQHVRKSVHHPQAGDIAGIAQALFRQAGISTYSTAACVSLFGSNNLASASRRASGTLATPIRAEVDPMRASWCAPVRMVNKDVLPVMGRPMMAVFIMEVTCLA